MVLRMLQFEGDPSKMLKAVALALILIEILVMIWVFGMGNSI